MDLLKPVVAAFVAGFVSTLLFHQGALALLHVAGLSTKAPFAMEPTAPFGVPAVLSLAFWGGLWGIPLWLAIRALPQFPDWGLGLVLGALLPSIVALGLVFPLKGLPFAGGWDPKLITGALIVNGAWGIGVALLLRLLARF